MTEYLYYFHLNQPESNFSILILPFVCTHYNIVLSLYFFKKYIQGRKAVKKGSYVICQEAKEEIKVTIEMLKYVYYSAHL